MPCLFSHNRSVEELRKAKLDVKEAIEILDNRIQGESRHGVKNLLQLVAKGALESELSNIISLLACYGTS